MATLPALTGPSLAPPAGRKPDTLVVFLHGVGADGNDLIGLAPHFQNVLPNALFLSPHAPSPFEMAAQGRQWFSIRAVMEGKNEARLAGVQEAGPTLDAYLDAQLAEHRLAPSRLVLIGFSQGTMMALHVAPRRKDAIGAIIGYSGLLAGPDQLASQTRSRPPVLLVHGDADEVLPIAALPEAQDSLRAAGIEVESHVRPGLGHGIDDVAIEFGLEFLDRKLNGRGGS
ncbi:MAG: phospholipase [Rhodospirillales bacterium]|nr:phospholipase [Rhodospirillales bacterium]